MNLTKNGITLIVDDAEIMRIALERLQVSELAPAPRGVTVPCIGDVWPGQGGIYAGIMRGRDGGVDYHLIVGPECDGADTWDALMAWAKQLTVDGHSDFALHFRKEQALCFANVPELFKPDVYWSCEAHASDSGRAWFQYFNDGGQLGWSKDDKLRARAVRRLAIQ